MELQKNHRNAFGIKDRTVKDMIVTVTKRDSYQKTLIKLLTISKGKNLSLFTYLFNKFCTKTYIKFGKYIKILWNKKNCQ